MIENEALKQAEAKRKLIEEGNKAIAKFTNRIKTYDAVDDNSYMGEITLTTGLEEEQTEGEISHFQDRYSITPVIVETPLKYHESFNELMPVIEKVFKAMNGEEKYQLLHSQTLDALMELNIDKLHRAVVAFVRFYNEQ